MKIVWKQRKLIKKVKYKCILFNLSSKEVENLDSNTKKYLGEGLVEFVKFSDTLIPFGKALNLIEPWSPFRRDIERAVNFGSYNAESTNDTLLYSLNESPALPDFSNFFFYLPFPPII